MRILTDIPLGDVRVEHHKEWAESATSIFSKENTLWYKIDQIDLPFLKTCCKLVNDEIISIIGAHLVRKNFDLVVMSPKAGIKFGLLRYLTISRNPRLVLFHFWLQDKGSGLFHGVIDAIKKYGIRSADLIIVPSVSEIELYSDRFNLSKDKFACIPYHVHSNAWRLPTKEGNYVFSAGASVRDYKTLLSTAKSFENKKFIIVSDKLSIEGLSYLNNVEIFVDIPHDQYLEKLSECQIVVIPLKRVSRSAGQRTILEAMAMGKAVIVSDIAGVRDYIINDRNGILVEPENVEQLTSQIRRLLTDGDLRATICKNAYEYAKKHFVFEKNFLAMFNLLRSIAQNDFLS